MIKKIEEAILKARKIAIGCHQRPDGDCLGAGLALTLALNKIGKNATFFSEDMIPERLHVLPCFESVSNQASDEIFDLFISVDCGDLNRLGKYKDTFIKSKKTVNIDHHKTNDRFAELNLVKIDYSSSSEIVFELLDSMSIELDKDIATCLYIGISSDTGNFAHSNTTRNALRIVSKLLEYDFPLYKINTELYRRRSYKKTMLIARAISSMKMFSDNKIAIISITLKDLKETGCDLSDTESIIDYAIEIDCVRIGVCIAQQNDNLYKVSFRSREGYNVSEVARVFGGGGHVQASGCIIKGSYEHVIDKLSRECMKALVD